MKKFTDGLEIILFHKTGTEAIRFQWAITGSFSTKKMIPGREKGQSQNRERMERREQTKYQDVCDCSDAKWPSPEDLALWQVYAGFSGLRVLT